MTLCHLDGWSSSSRGNDDSDEPFLYVKESSVALYDDKGEAIKDDALSSNVLEDLDDDDKRDRAVDGERRVGKKENAKERTFKTSNNTATIGILPILKATALDCEFLQLIGSIVWYGMVRYGKKVC